jgi:hypothetical protein
MKNKFLILHISIVLIFTIESVSGQYVMDNAIVAGNTINPKVHHATAKKLIHTSSSLQWSFVKDNIGSMESRHPYLDGVAASMNGDFSKNFLMLRGDKLWTEEDVQLRTVSEIKWGKYTDNFVILYFGDSLDPGFFNNDKWAIINRNAEMVSKMIKAGRFKGIFVDDENYFEGSHGWKYDPAWYPGYTFEQVKSQCRQRGKDFMKAVQTNVTNPLTVFDFIWFGDHWNNYDTENGRQVLWLAFKDGMLDAARSGDVFVEGNEMAYYYQESTMFTDIYNEFRLHKFTKYGSVDLQDKYKTQVQIGHGIYPSLYYGLFRWPHTYTTEEHDIWWKQQLYHGLLTTDRYVWIWSERWDWFGDQSLPLTPNFSSIVGEVKSKINNQQGLNYDLVKSGNNWAGDLTKPTEKWRVSTSPQITIISPVNKSTVKGTITIKTKMSDPVSRVEFYINSMRVGIDSLPPYTAKVSGLANGKYTIFARSFDAKKQHLTSAPIVVTVGKSNE